MDEEDQWGREVALFLARLAVSVFVFTCSALVLSVLCGLEFTAKLQSDQNQVWKSLDVHAKNLFLNLISCFLFLWENFGECTDVVDEWKCKTM